MMRIRHLLIPHFLHAYNDEHWARWKTEKCHKDGSICQPGEWDSCSVINALTDTKQKLKWKLLFLIVVEIEQTTHNDDDRGMENYFLSLHKNLINWRLFFIGFSSSSHRFLSLLAGFFFRLKYEALCGKPIFQVRVETLLFCCFTIKVSRRWKFEDGKTFMER